MRKQVTEVGHEGIGSIGGLHKCVVTVQSLKVGHEKVGLMNRSVTWSG